MTCGGQLRHRILIQAQTPTRDAATGAVTSRAWATVATVWAQIQPFSAVEELTAGQKQAKRRYKIVIRYNSTVTTSHRIQLADGTNLDINGISNKDMRNIWQEIAATEIS